MGRRLQAASTVAFLKQRGGANWIDLAAEFGVTRAGVKNRIKAARIYLVEQGARETIARPTRENDFLYMVTGQLYGTSWTEPGITPGARDDLQAIRGILIRMRDQIEIGLDNEVNRKSGQYREGQKVAASLTLVIDETDKKEKVIRKYLARSMGT
jgi:hypothetical protein